MTENSNEDANNEFYEEAREILNEPVRTRAQKEFNKELEYSITKARTAKLDKEPILGNYDKVHLSKIHEAIFRRLYDYAGKFRDFNISKLCVNTENGDFEIGHFLESEKIDENLVKFSEKINNLNRLKGLNKDQFIENFTIYFAELNEIHPFPEGNGRATKVFMRQLANDAGYEIHYDKVNSNEWNYACKRSLSDQKVYVEHPVDPKPNTQAFKLLKNVFENIIEPLLKPEQNLAISAFTQGVKNRSTFILKKEKDREQNKDDDSNTPTFF